MTRQNAIKWLKDYRKNTDFEMPQYEEALDIAIQALSQEPCDDAISRDAVIKILEKYNLEMSKIAEDVSELPSVTQKSGKWIDIPFSHYYKCSECDKYQISATNYCPNCGAKMESEDKE